MPKVKVAKLLKRNVLQFDDPDVLDYFYALNLGSLGLSLYLDKVYSVYRLNIGSGTASQKDNGRYANKSLVNAVERIIHKHPKKKKIFFNQLFVCMIAGLVVGRDVDPLKRFILRNWSLLSPLIIYKCVKIKFAHRVRNEFK